jgi:hypothetical protein
MGILPKQKNLDNLTRLEREREIKRISGETEELIDEMGQRSDRKAVGTVQQYVKEQREQETLQQNLELEKLKQLSRNKIAYQRFLLVVLNRFLKEESIPKRFSLYADSTDEGIVLGINGSSLHGAFKVTGIPKYDINACKVLAVRMGNTIAKLQGYAHTTESGIVLPDALDKKKYGK